MTADLTGRTALVTGASRGLGRHIALALHAAGATVGITGRHAETLNAAAELIGERCVPFVCDQRDPEAIHAMADTVLSRLGAVDLLVNNAAAFAGGPVATLPVESWQAVIETNLTGVFLTTQAFLPAMLDLPRGDIVMISSMSGKKGDPGGAAYAASKFGLQGFSQALMYEVRKSNIRVMVLNPSAINTSLESGSEFGPGLKLHAADVAATVVHLCALPGRTMIRDLDLWGTNPTG